MTSKTIGRRAAPLATVVTRLAALSLLLLMPALSACTTADGTNALVDPGTFEREVMDSTLQGLDILPPNPEKGALQPRAPLVLPKRVGQLPPPSTGDNKALPTDSNNPQINTASLSPGDLQRLRGARVVDLHTLDGRPLTDTERKQLTARMMAANMTPRSNGDRPLTLPPVSYFSDYKGKDTVCKATDGTLVALNDKRCPAAVKDAMRKQAPEAPSVVNQMQQQQYDMAHGINPNDPNDVQYNGH
jgi:hypothetical protein